MHSTEEIKGALQSKKQELQDKYKIKTIAIFGSYARGEQKKESDLDVMVEFYEPLGLEFIDLANELEEIVGTRVDLVSKSGVKPKYFAVLSQDLIYV
ncbi:MAG: nucleotidyltransferase family protein [bacterium]|nr:nucleotidyltransferase family protein [bacterium]